MHEGTSALLSKWVGYDTTHNSLSLFFTHPFKIPSKGPLSLTPTVRREEIEFGISKDLKGHLSP